MTAIAPLQWFLLSLVFLLVAALIAFVRSNRDVVGAAVDSVTYSAVGNIVAVNRNFSLARIRTSISETTLAVRNKLEQNDQNIVQLKQRIRKEARRVMSRSKVIISSCQIVSQMQTSFRITFPGKFATRLKA
jgi:hypothetical protein